MALTTHVLDTALGRPAAGVEIVLVRGEDELARVFTDADGRARMAEELTAGVHELRFGVGAYLREAGHAVADPPFLDVVPVRFGVADRAAHHHVPLLVSPYGYSTYRGS